ncbi:MAG: homoserine kinase [Gammaproteobacteria bacterium]|nr:homoserine kinase [Gammaproteobacteria bacterium]
MDRNIVDTCVAMAPPSVGNMAVGFDILGHALNAPGDQVRATRVAKHGVEINAVSGVATQLPRDAARNTAGLGVIRLLEEQGADFGVVLDVHKHIALGSGMGGSASSAVAAVVAVNQLLNEPLEPEELLRYALIGEAVASDAVHGDNVAPCLFGGIVFIPPQRPQDFVRVPVPTGLHCVLVRPEIRLDTRAGRKLLDTSCGLDRVVQQTANLAGVLCACYNNDLEGLRHALNDVLIEPQRSQQIAGFDAIKTAALDAGALGCAISGSGPSMIAWCEQSAAPQIAENMKSAVRRFHPEYQMLQSAVESPGAEVIPMEEWQGD